jgi:hypothetical protein
MTPTGNGMLNKLRHDRIFLKKNNFLDSAEGKWTGLDIAAWEK